MHERSDRVFRTRVTTLGVVAALGVAIGCAFPEPGAEPATLQGQDQVTGQVTGQMNDQGESVAPAAFRQDLEYRLDAAGDSMTIVGDDGWLFFGPELRHLTVGPFWGAAAASVSRAPSPEHADPLPAILDFHAQLEAVGVELLVLPVPAKAVVYPDKISTVVAEQGDRPGRLDEHHLAFYDVLRARGIEVVDLTQEFLDASSSGADPLYCRQDTHWSGTACVLAAERLAAMIRERAWFDAVSKRAFDVESSEFEITGDLWRLLGDESLGKERLTLRVVGTRGDDALEPVADDPESPIVLLGDSHGLVFHVGDDLHARGAGLADQLAYELGFPLDVVAVRGSGATPARFNLLRKARRTSGYWDRKRLVIWVFAAREFTEADGWRLVPIDVD